MADLYGGFLVWRILVEKISMADSGNENLYGGGLCP